MKDSPRQASSERVRQRLLAHFEGTLSEGESEGLEENALADDELFEALEAAEAELVESYIRGELSGSDARVVEQVIARSPRLQEAAELVTALDTKAMLSRAQEAGSTSSSRTLDLRVVSVLLLILLAVVWARAEVSMRSLRSLAQQQKQATESLAGELNRAQEEIDRLSRGLARQEAEARLLRRTSED